jgi:hypothetical protein
VNISGGGEETLTIAKDSAGKLWIAYTAGSKVKVTAPRSPRPPARTIIGTPRRRCPCGHVKRGSGVLLSDK